MKQQKPITREGWSKIILVLAIALGAYLRFHPTMQAGFAINDGGMFAVMVDDLKANGFALPKFTTYNHLNIPYAYPPLGFYLGALASDMFGWDATRVVQWAPAFFATLSIPAFYFLSLQLLKNKFHAAVSTMFFAFMPRALWWFRWGAMATIVTGLILAAMNGYILEAILLGFTDGGASTPIGIGMWLGAIMWFNVWFVIWPNQKKALGMVEANADTKKAAGRIAMLFSRTNTLLSIPMLYCMVAAQNGGFM